MVKDEKSEVFNGKQSLWTKMFSSVITDNLNWQILTNDLVTFKGWDGLRMKNFNIMGVYWKKWIFKGVQEKPIYRGNCLKRGLGQFADLEGAWQKKKVEGGLIP